MSARRENACAGNGADAPACEVERGDEEGEGVLENAGRQPTLLCISTYEKGQAFLREAARLGTRVLLLTVDKLRDADWPRDSLAGVWTMPEGLTAMQVCNTVCYMARTEPIDAIVALDEFDLEVAATLREHLQLRGMGESATRLFRDKLAMRERARRTGLRVPEFTRVISHDEVWRYLEQVPGPWLLKPRTNASAIGIHKVRERAEIWPLLERLGDEASHYVLERFVPGDIFHVEGVTWEGEVLFGLPFAYGKPPMETMHEGGVFSTRVLDRERGVGRTLVEFNREILRSLGMRSGVTHTEFIRAHADGQMYFLETAARVGGAHIAEVVEFATGLNPWVEWARIEVAALRRAAYALPALRAGYAGSVISLSRQETPDTASYDAAEVVERLRRPYHAGLIVRSESAERVEELVREYSGRFLEEFCAVLPPPDRPTA